ncbi:reverse transcriptase domain-containing protein [Flavobacterium aquiphilum]|uniref:reverse transcriptase domain-containing protein n=1 Tax=Flavobacterium aquiphilum TaxID=3003261 RepID=UPI00248020AA|nr:reverse transcriptase domain-containing protein [Flavobacterium aquiphilum]
MDFEQYSYTFSKEALKSGYAKQEIDRCLNYAMVLFSHNVPVIYNASHLAQLVGYKKEYLKKATLYTNNFYRNFEIVKKNGGKRLISEPLPSLKEIQLWILKNILYKIPVNPVAKAYKPNVKIIENLRFHRNQPKVLTLDLQNFFPSIKINAIQNIFRNLGYSKFISRLLAKLCTKNDELPQGAPTSPYLSNLIFKKADALIFDFCKQRKIRYTRYADDLCFSGNFDEKELLEKVIDVVEEMGFSINMVKTKLMFPNTRQTVIGVVVNEKSQVVFHKRNALRQAIYYIKKFGLNEHQEYKGIRQKNYLEHLLGKINFVLQINPKDTEFLNYKDFLIDLKKRNEQGKQVIID